jgi:RNA polymerase sigma-70 factor (ECF subfamily)
MIFRHKVKLEDVFLDHRDEVRALIRRRVGMADLAEDIAHDVYMKCRNFEQSFANRAEARLYLLKMAINLSIDYNRIERRRAEILGELLPVVETYDAAAADPESYALAGDVARLVEETLAKLPKLTRQMFIMVRLRGMTHQEVASELGVSKSLVDKYMVQALLKCRDAIGGLDRLDC